MWLPAPGITTMMTSYYNNAGTFNQSSSNSISRRTSPTLIHTRSLARLKLPMVSCKYFLSFLLVVVSLVFVSFTTVKGQQRPFAIVPKFDRSISYRTNVCDRQLMLYNGTFDLPDALRGLNLTVSITNYSNGKETLFFTLDPATDEIDRTNPGVFALMLDELSTRAGFTWRDTFIPYPPLDPTTDGNQTWTDILSWAIDTVDISMERWAQTVDRLAIPASFPVSWYDNSIVLGEIIQPKSQAKRVFYVWSFLDPFQLTLWLGLLCAIAVTGIVYYILELWNANADELDLECKPIASIFYAAITFTGHYELRPQTHPARLVGFSFTFWALIVGSAYTANLASFLVTPRVVSYKYSSIEKIAKSKAHVCVQKGGAIAKLLSQLHPELILVPKTPDEEIFKGLRYPTAEGGCDVVAHQFNTYEIYENLRETNDDCSLRSDKRIIEILPAGLATAVDTGSQYCTSLISHVLDYHLTTMIDDGFIERMWKAQLDRIATVSCASTTTSGSTLSDDETLSLTIQDIGGIFIVHVVLSFAAILIATIQFYYTHKRGEIIDDRTLSTAFGVTHVKQAIDSRLSQRDLRVSGGTAELSSEFNQYPRANSIAAIQSKYQESGSSDNETTRNISKLSESPNPIEDLILSSNDSDDEMMA